MVDWPAEEEDAERPSKSERKRQMHALQELGESLLALNDAQLARMPVHDPQLLEALHEARAIRSNSARKRHLQYIGKLMRGIDAEPIRRALDTLHAVRRADSAAFHELEQMREAVLTAGDEGIEQVVSRWPGADRQHLRQLLRQQRREEREGRPPAASRKLFRYLRELAETSDGSG